MATTFLEPGTDATQDFSLWGNSTSVDLTGALTSATDQAHTGTRSIKSSVGSNTGTLAQAYTGDGIFSDAGGRFSIWIRLNAIPATNKTAILWVGQSGFGSAVFAIGVDTAGKVTVGNEGGAGILGTGTTVVSDATWTRISAAYVITSTTNWTYKQWVNGVLDLTLTNSPTLTTVTSGELWVGASPASSAGFSLCEANLIVWVDDIYCDDSNALTDPGDIRVTAKRPIANGTTNGFTTQIGSGGSGTGTGHSPQVNEQPLSQTNGWSMVGAGSAVTEEYNVQSLSAGDVDLTGQTIVDWMGWAFAKALASETASIVVGGVSSNIALTSTPTAFQKAKGSTTYPAGSGTDIGIITSTTVTTVSLYECGVLIAYTPSTVVAIATPAGAAKFAGQAPWSLVEDTYVPHLIIKNRLAP
jgi:hypothetical protein